MDQIPQGTFNDFSLQYYNNYLLKNKEINKSIEIKLNDLEITNNNDNNIDTEYTLDTEGNDVKNVPNIYRNNTYKDNILKDILNKNKNNSDEGLQEEYSQYLSNFSSKKNHDNLNIFLNNNQIDISENPQEINDINNYYPKKINTKNALLNFIYYQSTRRNLFEKINFNKDNLKTFNPQDKMFSSNNVNYDDFCNNKFNLNNQNEVFNDNIFNSFNEKLFNKSIIDNYNQFINSNIDIEFSTEKNQINDPNSEENLKKIEQQITSLLFSSHKNNPTEKLNNSNKNNATNKEKISNTLNLDKKPSLSRLVSQLDSMVESDKSINKNNVIIIFI